MKGFKLDSNGDIAMEYHNKGYIKTITGKAVVGKAVVGGVHTYGNPQIIMIDGNELLRQTVECVLSTNKGEWVLNPDEGIDFHNILGKGNTEEIIRNELQEGLLQVDSSFIITSFSMELNERALKVAFSAQSNDETVSGVINYA